ncbi:MULTISPECIES: large conductance mechanosensitive channel protein MscL [Aequorivita]|jgi:large conductance mechanosensitive channel|uniref:Large-conductance mechanosensitive channel n=2 Tax=Aequorivita TaxID=153265 RepID=A0ABX7DVR6_9FLAO|nr:MULTISPECIES: large conductance mechanosensitive channel protein MscL [Aequorivita]MAB56371.1 large conductance mechanosensitive channel protein MscL [Aequorivita sp.]KJJ38523.1 mechanosensitive ion channel protein MscL [Aequorivita vladivostokensis]MBF29915.1 large conductance mechanosensitive channel protein MscL [Aequorivita sp.]QQX77731.1 large conductance mechanosensitive channel protein MscL [Aequorivita iocasae]UCA57229.1 large conductance mechanosensitive channel protein MscL [Aequo|tara:strand:- start:103414 stop:103824 length:411 start_codon:yes stop_codon:yes gene_type:complete
MLKEFRDFIMTGNVVDLAVAVLLAAAVGTVVSSFTNDVMMPIVGNFTGGVDFADLKVVLSEAVVAPDGEITKPENAIMYGKWINSIINLIIVGFVLFLIVKAYGKVRKKKEEAPAPDPGPSEKDLLMQIRDELRKK